MINDKTPTLHSNLNNKMLSYHKIHNPHSIRKMLCT